MQLQRLVEPIAEPITIAEARAQCRVDITDDDALLAINIFAVRSYAENHTERSLCTQTWEMTLDEFPHRGIVLERPPIQSITSVRYLDMQGVWQTMPASDYVDLTQGGAQRVDDNVRIAPAFGKTWPIPMPQIGCVKVRYVAGYGSISDVPPTIRAWMFLRLGSLYENREDVVSGASLQPLPFADAMLSQFTVRRCA